MLRYVEQEGLVVPSRTAAGYRRYGIRELNQLSTHPHVAALLGTRELNVYGWYYDIGSGRVLQYDQQSGVFEDLNGEARPASPHPRRASAAVDGWDSEARLVPEVA